MSNSSSSSSGGIGFLGLLTIVFIVLKLTNVIDWHWFWVLSPMILGGFFVLLVILLSIFWVPLLAIIYSLFKNRGK